MNETAELNAKIGVSMADFNSAMQAATTSMTDLAAAANAAGKRAANAFSPVVKSIAEVPEVASAAAASMKPMLQSLGQIGNMLSLAVTAPLLAVGKAAIDAAVDMDGLTRGLIAVTGSAEDANRELVQLREIGKLPGLGFREAIQGAVNLQAAGLSAKEATSALSAFGNAIATVGGGREKLQFVEQELTRLAAAPRVSAREIQELARQVPQIRTAMLNAYGTTDTELLEKAGITSREFLKTMTTEVAKAGKVVGSLKNDFENAQIEITNSLKEIGDTVAPLAAKFLNDLTPALAGAADAFKSFPQGTVALVGIAAAVGPIASVTAQVIELATALKGAQLAAAGPAGLAAALVLLAGLFGADLMNQDSDAKTAAAGKSALQSTQERIRELRKQIDDLQKDVAQPVAVPAVGVAVPEDGIATKNAPGQAGWGTAGKVIADNALQTATDNAAKLAQARTELKDQEKLMAGLQKDAERVSKAATTRQKAADYAASPAGRAAALAKLNARIAAQAAKEEAEKEQKSYDDQRDSLQREISALQGGASEAVAGMVGQHKQWNVAMAETVDRLQKQKQALVDGASARDGAAKELAKINAQIADFKAIGREGFQTFRAGLDAGVDDATAHRLYDAKQNLDALQQSAAAATTQIKALHTAMASQALDQLNAKLKADPSNANLQRHIARVKALQTIFGSDHSEAENESLFKRASPDVRKSVNDLTSLTLQTMQQDEVQRRAAESARAMAEAVSKATAAYADMGADLKQAQDALAVESGQMSSEQAEIDKLTAKYAQFGWRGLIVAGQIAALADQTKTLKLSREEDVKAMRDEAAVSRRLGDGLQDLAARYDDLFKRRRDYQADTLAKFNLPANEEGMTQKQIDAVDQYAAAWKQLDVLEKHRQQLAQIADTLNGTFSDAFSRALEKGKGFGAALVDSIRHTVRQIVVEFAAEKITGAIMSGLGKLGGAAGDFFSTDKLRSASTAASDSLRLASSGLIEAAREIERAADKLAKNATASATSAIEPLTKTMRDISSPGTWGAMSFDGSNASRDAQIATGVTSAASSAQGGGLSGAAGAAGSIAAMHGLFTGGFGSTLAGLSRAMPYVGAGLMVDQLLGDPIGKLLKKFHLRLATGAWEIPGKHGAGDIVPALLSPGEMVLPVGFAEGMRRASSTAHQGSDGLNGGFGGDLHLTINGGVNNAADLKSLQGAVTRAVQTGRRTPAAAAGGRW